MFISWRKNYKIVTNNFLVDFFSLGCSFSTSNEQAWRASLQGSITILNLSGQEHSKRQTSLFRRLAVAIRTYSSYGEHIHAKSKYISRKKGWTQQKTQGKRVTARNSKTQENYPELYKNLIYFSHKTVEKR